MPTIADNVSAVRAAITEACRGAGRDPANVRLIAVTKAQGGAVLGALSASGVLDFGENRIDHLALMAADAPEGARFHHIGRLQSRQLADVVARAGCVHGLCDLEHAHRLDRLLAAKGGRLEVFVQVNTSGEAAKAGLAPETLGAFLDHARALPHLDVVGLMTMAPGSDVAGGDECSVRRCFAALRKAATGHGLNRLSMGMSQDFVHAVREGATDVRIGTRLFA